MNLFRSIFDRAADALIARVTRRPPDFVGGGHGNPYLRRWYLTPWRRWPAQARERPTRLNRIKARLAPLLPNIYLHQFLRSDDDRALHDHPWPWCSILLQGGYVEHTIRAGGIHQRRTRYAPSVKVAMPWRAHRVELLHAWWMQENLDDAFDVWAQRPNDLQPCWTLFVTGPRVRGWGFHCPHRGWVPWYEFTAADDPGAIGPGCGEANDNALRRQAVA